jgi:hypothetical protein
MKAAAGKRVEKGRGREESSPHQWLLGDESIYRSVHPFDPSSVMAKQLELGSFLTVLTFFSFRSLPLRCDSRSGKRRHMTDFCRSDRSSLLLLLLRRLPDPQVPIGLLLLCCCCRRRQGCSCCCCCCRYRWGLDLCNDAADSYSDSRRNLRDPYSLFEGASKWRKGGGRTPTPEIEQQNKKQDCFRGTNSSSISKGRSAFCPFSFSIVHFAIFCSNKQVCSCFSGAYYGADSRRV